MKNIAEIVRYVVVVGVVSLGVGACTPESVADPRQAEKIAIAEVERAERQLSFDASLFDGPQPTTVGGADYAFIWRYADAEGVIEMLVAVDRFGDSEISWKGNLDRIRAKK